MAWTTEEAKNPRWRLYVKPVELKAGEKLRAKSCRLGWRDSGEVGV
jgi:hypothetical protein